MKLARIFEYFTVLSFILLSSFYSDSAFSLTADTGKSIELSGSFSVSGGQVSYSLPISVPTGRAGHQPLLSMEYRSDSPNGMLGIGWNLGGLSSITRCGKNIHKDGRWGGVKFDSNDRYCLDGQRLVAISGRDGGNLTEYRVENNGFAKIVSFGQAGNGPASFKVWYKNGSVYEYGVTQDSRAELPQKADVYKWALNKITDASKFNHINFIYTEENAAGKHKLTQITYVGGKIDFVYEVRGDSSSQYLGGQLLNKTERLKEIKIFDSSNNHIGNYRLTYQLSSATSRSRLISVNYCTNDLCSSDIRFEWNGRNVVELQGPVNTGLTNPRYIESNDSGFSTAYGEVSRNSNNRMSVLDLNGLVRPNIRSFGINGSITSPSIALNVCPINTARTYNRGNGRYGTYCQFNSCSGNSCKYSSNGVNYGDFDGDGDEERITGYSSIDINGDGIDDLHKFDVPGGNYRYRISQQGSWLTLPSAGGRVLKSFTDINNDGYLDAVMGSSNAQGNLYVHLFNGKTFNPPIVINRSVSHQSDVYFADLNNDGYPELGYGRYFYKNNRNNSFSSNIFLDAGAKIYSVQDVNGDGWVDVITRANGKNVKARIQYSTAQEQDKITTFSEVGIDYTVAYLHASTGVYSTYVSSSDIATPAPYAELGQGAVSYPYKVVTPKRYLVSSVIKSPKGYMPTTYTYRYEGAKQHLRGGGFLGFKTITETENADVVTVTKTTFEQDRLEVSGRPLAVEVQKNGKKVSEVSYQYKQHTREGYNANYYQVYPEQVVDIKFGLGSDVAERIETTTRELDRFGNLLNETSVVSSDIEGAGQFTSTKQSDYLSTDFTELGDSYWKIGAAINLISTLTDNTTNLTRHIYKTYSYDSRGYLTQSTEMSSAYELTDDISTTGKTTTNRYSYDQWGNNVSQTIEGTDLPARTSTTQYDNQGLYVISSVNALGHTTTSQFNAQGQLTESVSALKDRTTSFDYDAFGRVISETLPGVNNTKTTQYRLGSQCGGPYEIPLSKTVSCVTFNSSSGGEVRLYFDYAGREVRRFHTSFDGQLIAVDTLWDRNGRKLSVTRPHFFDPWRDARLEEYAPTVSYTYDALNREVSKQEPASDGGVANFTTTYEGYTTSVTDARGFIRSTVTNVMGYILRKDEPLGAYQTYQYYPDGKLRSTIDSNGNTTQIRYDNLGHRSYLDDPDMGQWSYTYNAAGELIYKRDAKGTVTTIEYDLLGRKINQTEDGQVSSWRYDERGALGTLSGFSGNGSETDYYYNESGLTEEIAVEVNNEKFSTNYFYDMYERISREVRPNGVDTSFAGSVAQLSNINSEQRLAIEYVYNPNGYMSAVRSPKNYADDVFTSASFRDGIRQLLEQAIALATEYLTKAERYYYQRAFYLSEAQRYYTKNISEYYIHYASLEMLGDDDRFKLYCTEQNVCYLRPIKWVIISDDVSIPLKVGLKDNIYRLYNIGMGQEFDSYDYYTILVPASKEEFASQSFTRFDDMLLFDYDDYTGGRYLVSSDEGFADEQTKAELSFTANELFEAESIASTRYKHYFELVQDLFGLIEKVADLSGEYCEYANQLGGNQLDDNQRSNCQNTRVSSQADHLALILTQSELEESLNNPAYIYYWQRRETDAYDHTLSETLGNGLVNTYNYDANTGRPSFITTHKANVLFDPRLSGSRAKGRNVRSIQYRYDSHNNVTYRYDDQLGITDTWQYDALDRVISNNVSLSNPAEYGVSSPDFAGTFDYQYDNLGNLIFKTGIGNYVYSAQQAGPHAVTQANGLNYQYDANGNMLRAWTDGNQYNERELEWTEFNKPSKIIRNGKIVEFSYDANHNRYLKTNSDGLETFYFGKTYERVTDTNTGVVQHKQFIYADGKLIALNTQVNDLEDSLQDKQIRYLHYDALNSVDMITDGYGLIVERRSYDTWGKKRNVLWREDGPLDVVQAAITSRGYTGHEEIVEVDLVHMNGRVYDQEFGRFISPDPIVQAPYATNSFNRYAYVMNNPLKYTDPTGFRAIEGAGISEPGIKDGMGKYDPPRDNGSSSREPSNRKDRDRSTPSTPVKPKPKPKEEQEPKVVPTVEPLSPKNHWGNKDFAGEMDPAVRNKALSDTINSLTGAEDFVDAAETVLDANATVVDKVVAVGAAFSKRTPIGKVAGKVVTKGVEELTTQQQKAIRSLEKQIAKHEKKVQDFKDNPTVRPGMENLPKEVIQKQQQRRIQHLETEINTFKNNIDKIKRGEIGS